MLLWYCTLFRSVLMQRTGPADMVREQSSFSSHPAQKPLLYIPAPVPFSPDPRNPNSPPSPPILNHPALCFLEH